MRTRRTPLFVGLESRLPAHQPDDLETHLHRQVIGWLGVAMPVLVWVLAGLMTTKGLEPWVLLDSVSAYFYTGAVVAFVGILCVLAVFLLTYRGYASSRQDRVAGLIAGFAALGVAFLPTAEPSGVPRLDWWEGWVGRAHGIAATILFLSFIWFALVLFPKSGGVRWKQLPRDKRRRNLIYYACGLVMLGCVICAGILTWTGKPIFLPESIALVSFAVSWLIKGRVDRLPGAARDTAKEAGRKLLGKTMNPTHRP